MLPYKNLSLKNLPGEEWIDIPGFCDYYMISNFGRVRSLERWIERPLKGTLHIKEKILKQTVIKRKNPFTKKYVKEITITICRNSKKKTIVINRLVYFHFVTEFDMDDETLVVVYKNGNNLDHHFENLQLITVSEQQKRTYAQHKRRRPVKVVSQYNQAGEKIKTYPSIIEAARQTGCRPPFLTATLNGRSRHCKGWQWKFGTRPKIKPIAFPYKNVRRISQHTLNGKLMKVFFSILEAVRLTGFDDIGIRDCARGKRASYKGYTWKYVDHN